MGPLLMTLSPQRPVSIPLPLYTCHPVQLPPPSPFFLEHTPKHPLMVSMGLVAQARGIPQSVSHGLSPPALKRCVSFCIWTWVLLPSSLGGHYEPSDRWASLMVSPGQSLALNTAQGTPLGTAHKHLKFQPSE